MSATIHNFVGDWNVKWVAGSFKVVAEGDRLLIGPAIDERRVDYVLSRFDGQSWEPFRTSSEFGPLELVDGSLRWEGFAAMDPDLPTRIYVSIAEGRTLDGTFFRSLYGTTLRGDPDQVVVWGANDSPP